MKTYNENKSRRAQEQKSGRAQEYESENKKVSRTDVLASIRRDLLHARIEARVAHAVTKDSRELVGINFHSKVGESWT